MELCSNALKTLKAVGSSKGDVGMERKELAQIAQWTLEEMSAGGDAKLPDSSVLAKNVHSALTVLYLESAKHGLETGEVADVLESQCGWTNQGYLTAVTAKWAEALPRLRERLAAMAVSDPAITSLSWSAHHVLGDRELETPTKSTTRYHLELNLKSADEDAFHISCTAEQMQVC